jgi:hypothetical protein
LKTHSILFLLFAAGAGAAEISFNRDIRPILSDTCFHCHGPDAAKQSPKSKPLTFQSFEQATADRGGYAAIVAGHPESSEMINRIFSDDPDEVMPPPDSNRSITAEQKELLKQWVAEGAKYEKHWAFVHPVKTPLPTVSDETWAQNGLDPFVLARLDTEGLKPNPESDKETLIRRATLALIGLNPTPAEVDTFLADTSPNAYGNLLDRLLASPKYGERMTAFWLEAARYADTDGYQNDGERTMWPWRDWVIKAFNDNMPFDEFSIKQLAGDMLPGDDVQNVLASAFNRNHRINNEGGALPEEFIVEYAIDRVETTGTVWMGLTAGCARCHDHKYDPLSHKEFYQMFAYFNSISESGKAAGSNAPPLIKIGSPLQNPETQQKLHELNSELDKTRADLKAKKAQEAWERSILADVKPTNWETGSVIRTSTTAGSVLEKQDDGSLLQKGKSKGNETYAVEIENSELKQLASMRLEVMPDPGFKHLARSANGNFVLSEVKLSVRGADGKLSRITFGAASSNFSQNGYPVSNLIDGKSGGGWAADGYKIKNGPMIALLDLKEPIILSKGSRLVVELEHPSGFADHNIGRFRLLFSDSRHSLESPLMAALQAKKQSKAQSALVLKEYEKTEPKIVDLESKIAAIKVQEVNVLVMREAETPAATYLLERGQYISPDKSEVLQRGVPSVLTTKEQPKDRLELARWLTSADNPLGARVTVNRIWQQHFGIGIVKTPENFGLQGAAPSHPELLDWLAVDFMENGWDVKRLHKLILMSATWRQSSMAAPAMFERDPENRLMARGPRFRLDAGAIRDSALAAAGLLNETLGGPPVKPYQPDGLWAVVAANAGTKYDTSKGNDLYRRGLYTYWKRAVNPPRMLIFDSATREYCVVGRNATNTPLQALVLMNDVTFIEAARNLAERMMKDGGATVEQRLTYGFRLAIGNSPNKTELGAMRATYTDFKASFQADQAAAAELLSQGESPRDATLDIVEHAAYTAAAHLALNLDRAINLE